MNGKSDAVRQMLREDTTMQVENDAKKDLESDAFEKQVIEQKSTCCAACVKCTSEHIIGITAINQEDEHVQNLRESNESYICNSESGVSKTLPAEARSPKVFSGDSLRNDASLKRFAICVSSHATCESAAIKNVKHLKEPACTSDLENSKILHISVNNNADELHINDHAGSPKTKPSEIAILHHNKDSNCALHEFRAAQNLEYNITDIAAVPCNKYSKACNELSLKLDKIIEEIKLGKLKDDFPKSTVNKGLVKEINGKCINHTRISKCQQSLGSGCGSLIDINLSRETGIESNSGMQNVDINANVVKKLASESENCSGYMDSAGDKSLKHENQRLFIDTPIRTDSCPDKQISSISTSVRSSCSKDSGVCFDNSPDTSLDSTNISQDNVYFVQANSIKLSKVDLGSLNCTLEKLQSLAEPGTEKSSPKNQQVHSTNENIGIVPSVQNSSQKQSKEFAAILLSPNTSEQPAPYKEFAAILLSPKTSEDPDPRNECTAILLSKNTSERPDPCKEVDAILSSPNSSERLNPRTCNECTDILLSPDTSERLDPCNDIQNNSDSDSSTDYFRTISWYPRLGLSVENSPTSRASQAETIQDITATFSDVEDTSTPPDRLKPSSPFADLEKTPPVKLNNERFEDNSTCGVVLEDISLIRQTRMESESVISSQQCVVLNNIEKEMNPPNSIVLNDSSQLLQNENSPDFALNHGDIKIEVARKCSPEEAGSISFDEITEDLTSPSRRQALHYAESFNPQSLRVNRKACAIFNIACRELEGFKSPDMSCEQFTSSPVLKVENTTWPSSVTEREPIPASMIEREPIPASEQYFCINSSNDSLSPRLESDIVTDKTFGKSCGDHNEVPSLCSTSVLINLPSPEVDCADTSRFSFSVVPENVDFSKSENSQMFPPFEYAKDGNLDVSAINVTNLSLGALNSVIQGVCNKVLKQQHMVKQTNEIAMSKLPCIDMKPKKRCGPKTKLTPEFSHVTTEVESAQISACDKKSRKRGKKRKRRGRPRKVPTVEEDLSNAEDCPTRRKRGRPSIVHQQSNKLIGLSDDTNSMSIANKDPGDHSKRKLDDFANNAGKTNGKISFISSTFLEVNAGNPELEKANVLSNRKRLDYSFSSPPHLCRRTERRN